MSEFGGTTVTENDTERLTTQLDAVKQVMADGAWRNLERIAEVVFLLTGKKATEASVSARLRDLRKDKFGGYTVERKSAGNGLFLYRVV